jgi:hypothetical protein
MKSAYELAMERLGGETQYTDEQKEKLAEIDRNYNARVAGARLRADQVAKDNPDDPVAIQTAREETARDVARLEEKREGEKESARNK